MYFRLLRTLTPVYFLFGTLLLEVPCKIFSQDLIDCFTHPKLFTPSSLSRKSQRCQIFSNNNNCKKTRPLLRPEGKFRKSGDWITDSFALRCARGGGGTDQFTPNAFPSSAEYFDRRNLFTISSLWGCFGVLLLFANAMRKMWPYAIQPFSQGMSSTAWAGYASFTTFMLLVKGYLALHRKFCKLVVRRALVLGKKRRSAQAPKVPAFHYLLAPAFSMGLFHATTKRKITGWGTISIIIAFVVSVRRLPFPFRQIINGGVFAALGFGGCSIVFHCIRALNGFQIEIDPALPSGSPHMSS